ncbi:hypothetical protein RTBOTA2_006199 [Rhodotorula toruloides]|nr:hypothetical protein RTBOTA2_006199 [Rhodotorula toruloides]
MAPQLCTPFLELVAKLLSSSSASLSHKVHRCRAPCTVKSSSGTRAQTPPIVLKRLGKLREWTIDCTHQVRNSAKFAAK